VIAGDRIFLTGFEDGRLVVFCVKRSDGALLWKKAVATDGIEPYFQKLGTPAAPSCATDGERVVSYFGSCGLACHDLDGNELWTLKMPVTQTMDGFGTGNSPIIHEGRVYLTRDEYGTASGFYCLDVKTGKEIWRAPRWDVQVSYGTPVIWDGALVTVCDLPTTWQPEPSAGSSPGRLPIHAPPPPQGRMAGCTWPRGAAAAAMSRIRISTSCCRRWTRTRTENSVPPNW
jgi:hypothetical protein